MHAAPTHSSDQENENRRLYMWTFLAIGGHSRAVDHSAGVVMGEPEWSGPLRAPDGVVRTTPSKFQNRAGGMQRVVHGASRNPMGAVGPPDTQTTTPVQPLVLVYSKRTIQRFDRSCDVLELELLLVRIRVRKSNHANFGTKRQPPRGRLVSISRRV